MNRPPPKSPRTDPLFPYTTPFRSDAYGLLQPVIVSPATDKKSFFDVHAGGRRWRAIAQLIKSGELPKNAMVDARVCNDEKAALAEEISLAENIIREAMSPADECRGYRAAMDKGEIGRAHV